MIIGLLPLFPVVVVIGGALVLWAISVAAKKGPVGVGPAGELVALPACQREKMDGRIRICLHRDAQGTWDWYAQLPDESVFQSQTSGGYRDDEEALASAWAALFAAFPDEQPFSASIERSGLLAFANGRIEVTNPAVYVNTAAPVISQESDPSPMGLVVAVLLHYFPAANPLRLSPDGGTIDAAAARVQASIAESGGANPPAVARAIFGLPAGG